MLQPLIKHDQYSKLSDDIMMLGPNVILRMNVALYSNTENYGRISYHKEYEYYNSNTNSNSITMKRSFDYYLSIENVKATQDHNKEFIRIGMVEIMQIKHSFGAAIDWFVSPSYQGLYAYDKNKLSLTRNVDPIQISDLPMGKFLEIRPTVIVYNNGDQGMGATIFLSSYDNCVDMPLNKFMGLANFFNEINLYMAAQNMLNYLGRPDFGTNLHSFNSNQGPVSGEESVIGKEGRKIQAQNKISFFDTIDKQGRG